MALILHRWIGRRFPKLVWRHSGSAPPRRLLEWPPFPLETRRFEIVFPSETVGLREIMNESIWNTSHPPQALRGGRLELAVWNFYPYSFPYGFTMFAPDRLERLA